MNHGLLGSLATYPSLGMMSHKMYLPSIDDRWKYTYMPDIEEDKQKKESMEVSLDCTPYKDRFLKEATMIDKDTIYSIPLGDGYPVGYRYLKLVYCMKDGSEDVAYVNTGLPCETKSENTMKYRVGDKVRIKEELKAMYTSEKGLPMAVISEMRRMGGETHIITAVNEFNATYTLNGNSCLWVADMFEPVDEKECHKEMISKWWKTVTMKMETPSEENGKLTIPQIEPTFKFI